jgi:hypothetical protein
MPAKVLFFEPILCDTAEQPPEGPEVLSAARGWERRITFANEARRQKRETASLQEWIRQAFAALPGDHVASDDQQLTPPWAQIRVVT